MVCLRNICINTLHKGDNVVVVVVVDDDDDDDHDHDDDDDDKPKLAGKIKENKHMLLKLFLLNSTEVNIILLNFITSSSPHSTHGRQEFHESVDWESPLQSATILTDG